MEELHATILDRSIVSIAGLCDDCALLIHARLTGGREAYLLAYGNYAARGEAGEGEEFEGVIPATGL